MTPTIASASAARQRAEGRRPFGNTSRAIGSRPTGTDAIQDRSHATNPGTSALAVLTVIALVTAIDSSTHPKGFSGTRDTTAAPTTVSVVASNSHGAKFEAPRVIVGDSGVVIGLSLGA